MAALALLTLTLSTVPSMVVSIAQFPLPVMLPGQGKAPKVPEVPEVRLSAASPEPTFKSAVRPDSLIDETDAPVAQPDTPADGPMDVWAAAFGMKPGQRKPQGAPRPGAPGRMPPRGPAQGAARRPGARWPRQGAMMQGARKQKQASRPGAAGKVLPRRPAQGAAGGRGAPRQGAHLQEEGAMRKASAQDSSPFPDFGPWWDSRRGGAPTASQAPAARHACCEGERKVLAPLAKLTSRIEGHQSMIPKNVTQPWALPDVCRHAVLKKDLEHCYYNWGFTREASTCWATERLSMAGTCGKLCAPFKIRGKYSLLCENCMADLRKERRLCILKDMRITEACMGCQTKAYHHWDSNCMMQCIDSVNARNELAHKPDCAACTDNVDAMLRQCGAV